MFLSLRYLLAIVRWLIFALVTVGWLQGLAQSQSSQINRVINVRFTTLGEASLEIRYDLVRSQPGDSIYFTVYRRDNTPLKVNPAFVKGNFGRNIAVGLNKRINWNVLANGYELDEEVRVQVLVNVAKPPIPPKTTLPSQKPTVIVSNAIPSTVIPKPDTTDRPYPPKTPRPGGPALALLSVLMPGLGNVFVQRPKPKVGFRPLLPIAVAGALVYGLAQRTQEHEQYALYNQQRNQEIGEAYFQRANTNHHRYYIATRLAAVAWLTDIAATFVRGLRNQHSLRSNITVHPGYQSTVPVVTLTLRL